MAVIGSGPAGFYTAYRVMSLIDGAKVDMYEALPVPFGLVRFGVAPDHPEVKVSYNFGALLHQPFAVLLLHQKDRRTSIVSSNPPEQNCEDKFTEVASSPNFTFIGNVTVGHPSNHPGGQSVQLRTLLRHYDAVLFAYGASKDRNLGVPGESLRRIYSAREFVGWYNGLPEFAGLDPDLSQDTAVVLGQGNVAMDVARILLKSPADLRGTDIAGYAADALARSRVRRVRVVGRRGPAQASFTVKELRELVNLEGARMDPVEEGLLPPDLKALPRAPRRLMEVLTKGSAAAASRQQAERSWALDFCMSPTEFLPDPSDPAAVGATGFRRNVLSDVFDPTASITHTEPATTMMKSPLVFRSIGYKSEPIPEFEDLGVLFDQRRGVIGNDGVHGRVAPTTDGEENRPRNHIPGLYCAGWVKRGPTGVIASTMEDAFATAAAIAEDWKAGTDFLGDGVTLEGREMESAGWEGVKSEGPKALAACAVDWEGWLAIDRAEKERGKSKGKARDKFTAVEEMLPLSTSRGTA